MSWNIAHESNRCSFWTSCTGVLWKRNFLCIVRNFGDNWHTEMGFLVLRIMYTSTETALKISYLGCFSFLFCQVYMVNKWWHYNAGRTALHMFHGHYSPRDWVVHIIDKSNICVRKTFNVHNAWILAQFDHLASSGVMFSVHRALNNTETELLGLCFAFLMCIHNTMRDVAYSWITSQPVLVRGPLCRETLERTFLWHTSAICPECETIRLVRNWPSHVSRKRNRWWKARFRCYLRLSAQRISNQDGLHRDPTVKKMSRIIHK